MRAFAQEPAPDEVVGLVEAVATREGAPKYTVSDQGSQFVSAEFVSLRRRCVTRQNRPQGPPGDRTAPPPKAGRHRSRLRPADTPAGRERLRVF